MSAAKLVLHPSDCAAAPDASAILQRLLELEFIGTAFTLDARTHFYTGDAFLDGVSFLGCAPSIQLDPPTEQSDLPSAARAGRFCHIQLHSATAQPQPRYKPDQSPRCRQCRSAIPASILMNWNSNQACPSCGKAAALADLNWRQSGGFSRLYMDIWGIHTAEAVPSDRLLDGLARASGGPWQFFYIED